MLISNNAQRIIHELNVGYDNRALNMFQIWFREIQIILCLRETEVDLCNIDSRIGKCDGYSLKVLKKGHTLDFDKRFKNCFNGRYKTVETLINEGRDITYIWKAMGYIGYSVGYNMFESELRKYLTYKKTYRYLVRNYWKYIVVKDNKITIAPKRVFTYGMRNKI